MTTKWCIVVIENHPDKIVESIIGPFDDQPTADAHADMLDRRSDNYSAGGSRLFHHRVTQMTNPDD